ncbi:MAG TPA: M1 family aminopeptidase [Thermoanaerobaculia bacterium]|nr:M1 family aminopeptidase [Thermoanaerobaculia bacterium]
MSLARTRAVFALELAQTFKRPLFWFLVVLLALTSWLMATGDMTIQSGDASVGGTRAWITSEFNFAFLMTMLVTLIYAFFASIASGLAVIADDEARMGEILHATPLRPAEYVWGKFLAIVAGFLAALAFHLLFAVFFNHVVPNPEAPEIRGPFEPVNYLRPVLVFALPTLLFYLGVAFFMGERWRRPLTVFLFPTAAFLLCGFFLWDWAPTWLDPRINQALMLIDPAGFRWLNETWLKLDRGAEFYNTAPIGLDAPFVLSRIAIAALGLLGVVLAQRHLATHLQGAAAGTPRWRPLGRRRRLVGQEAVDASVPLAGLRMRTRRVGLTSGAAAVAGTELRNVLASPGLYLFGALILLQTFGTSLLALGPFQTELLLTPGTLAVRVMNTLSVLLCALLMFYTAESLERERSTGLAAITFSSPGRTASLLFGKAVANSAAGVLVVLATFVGCAIALLVQGTVALDLWPFLLVWGLLLVPTFLVWTSFILAVQAIGGQRFLTYGIGLAVMIFTLYRQFTGTMSWVGNWWIWSGVTWSDMGTFELDRRALVLNRVLVLGLAVFFLALAVRFFGRRQADAIGTVHQVHPGPLAKMLLRLVPYAAVPLVAGVALWLAVLDGFQGESMEKKARDYWKQNLATWWDAPQPAVADVSLDLRVEPAERWLQSKGSYVLVNDEREPLGRFALTGGLHWEKVRWTLNGKPYEPENRSGLYVFSPGAPLPPGGRVRVGFSFEGRFPDGVTKNGGGTGEFILPSGVVLTSFSPSFVPVVGYDEGIGRKEGENDFEPRVYPDDFYQGRTDALFGVETPFTTRISVTGPEDYAFNSVGTRVSDEVQDGRRTVVWKSDHPVRLFNVVGGRWDVRRGNGTVIYHHPGHPYNIAEMSAALDASRRWYSEWFYPFPWSELKLSEFPNLATYAQGFPTNITFSEGIGFLTKSDVKTDAVFLVTAHEAAHQWWGNILTPGKGPGANILSEGMSHFSTALLMEQVKGAQARMEFLKRIEENYGDSRRADAERPLVKIDGSRDGDQTVTYDKGGWVFWMMQRHMGRERALAGLRAFIAEWHDGPDYPVLQDFTAALRTHAPDPAAYDAFVEQWFHQVVVPEYRLSGARAGRVPGQGQWEVTVGVKNAGTGRMPVEMAAVRGERFGEEGRPKPGYREARTTVTLGAGEEKTVRIRAPFEPERVVVDPDVQVLQLRRKAAVAELK